MNGTHLREFGFSEIQHLDDGRIVLVLDQFLEAALHDCEDRPGEEGARVITLKALVKPKPDPGMGFTEKVDIEFEVDKKFPKMKSAAYEMGIRQKAGKPRAVYNQFSPDSVDQRTIFDEKEEEGEAES